MDEGQALLEGIAAEILEETGCDEPPVDAFELAELCGCEVRPGRRGGGGGRRGDVILVDVTARTVRQHGVVAHELGHWALERAGEDDSEDGARYLGGAFMLPRRPFERDLDATSWDLQALRARHLNASAEMIARRIVALRDGVASIWDQGKLRRRVSSPWLPEPFRRPTRLERELVAEVLEGGETVRADSMIWAVPVFDRGWRRVIVVAEAEQLSLRF
ncbi:MAG: ImmA/IrrE family metallo-endopeptidase [Myxococcota bacterium]